MTDLITPQTLRFERLLDAPIETVWRYLTDSELRTRWFMGGGIKQRAGGTMDFVMDHGTLSDDDVPTPAEYAGAVGHRWSERVVEIDPPRLLVISWEDGKAGTVRFELTDAGEQTRLLLTHSGLRGRDDAKNFGGGWHSHLEALGKRLRGDPVPNFWALHATSEATVAAALDQAPA